MRFRNFIILFSLCALAGCVTQEEFYLQNHVGYLEGPFRIKEGDELLSHTIRLPGKEEYALITKLKGTIIPKLEFSDSGIGEVIIELNEIQSALKGRPHIPIFLDLEGYENTRVEEASGGFDDFGDEDPFAEETPEDKEANEEEKGTVPKVTIVLNDSSMYDLLNIIAQLTGLHLNTRKGICLLHYKK